MISIKPYRKKQENKLLKLLLSEGDTWQEYTAIDKRDLYLLNCEKSLTYLLYEDEEVIGYIRALEDYGYYLYVCDLLVRSDQRGHGYGKQMIDYLTKTYPHLSLYIMSDEDDYYHKQGFHKVGSIFKV